MWLYVPNISTSSPSAQVDSASISASSWQFQALEQSVWWRGKPSQSRHWFQRWNKVSFIQLLCGLMPEPSMAALGVERLTASLAASRASLIASPAVSKGRTTNATSGLTLAASSSSQAHGSCSSKTSQACSRQGLTKSLAPSGFIETFESLVSRLRSDCSRRQKLARRTRESASSSSQWPTPATRDYKGANSADHLENGTGRKHLDQLPNFVEHLWTTPSAGDGQRGGTITENMSGTSLTQQVNSLWATPCARDHMPPHSPEYIALKKAQGHGMKILTDQADQWATPTASENANRTTQIAPSHGKTHGLVLAGQASDFSRQLPATTEDGSTPSKERRSLNPLFVEWLMGWPPGWTLLAWTDFGCSETELCRYRQLMRSALLRLPLPAAVPLRQLSLFG